jgi:carboxyl-terminal processing protease
VQQIIPLEPIFTRNGLSHHIDPGALKVTIRKFYRPDGASTQLRGVKPDLVLPSLTDVRDIAESAMKDPLPWDAVSILQHDSLNRVWPYVEFLRAKSTARLSNEADFVWLRDEVAQTRKNLETKSVSLNEAERRQEKLREQARADALKCERLARHETAPPTYEITVGNTASPGLPTASSAMKPIAEKSAASEAKPADDESSFATNIELREAENILADYIDLSALATVLTQR